MDPRYVVLEVATAWGNKNKLDLWQKTELAAIKARVLLGDIPGEVYDWIEAIWLGTPIDIEWWKERDKQIHHDLNAFIDERLRHLPSELQEHVHKKITSFDTEEAPFETILRACMKLVHGKCKELEEAIVGLAKKHRYTVMNARTHGQEAEMQTFGARCLNWYADFEVARNTLIQAGENLAFSKFSGAIGKYGSIDPKLEKAVLKILGFEPFFGATQIMPRILYLPVAQGLCGVVQVIDKIANDIRLNARSGRPLMREPFKKKQKGSSAMPHKRNPIRLEQLEGMARMARGFTDMIADNVRTWEERSIEQSCVERVAWPDLFHVVIHSLNVLTSVLKDLQVYPDNMLQEIHESRGTYASSEVKEFLKEHLAPKGVGYEDAYRMVQVACFNVFEPNPLRKTMRESTLKSFEDAGNFLNRIGDAHYTNKFLSIREFIPMAALRATDELDITEEQIGTYNAHLRELFADNAVLEAWTKLFEPSFLLKNEKELYDKILGV